MRYNKLDLNQLVVLDAILAERSVTKAADRLFLSQPATSCALSRLRDFFEDQLLTQVGKTLVLTPLADSLVKPVRDVLLQVQAITTTKPHFDPTTSMRKITVECSDYVMNVFISEVIRRAAWEAPLMQFDLRLIGTHSHENLDSGEIELLIAPEFFTSANHPSEPLFDDTFSCVTWIGNTSVGDELTIDDYMSLGHIGTEWGAGRLLTIDERLIEKHGYARRREVIVPSFTIVPGMLVGTNRVATLQTRLANIMVRNAPLRIFPCPIAIPGIVEMLQWHKYQERDLAISWFRDLLKRVANEMPKIHAPTSEESSDKNEIDPRKKKRTRTAPQKVKS
ncbi:LysR family transcriptional regulator [Glaciimonas sp. PCH181]|uniref:LysR family transcriptional regulator n=1 Tax=Glaciimonas sp. PCH181 TaxID=2133943 RepID=UPI000D38778E|nr:LysR family transcriptional regulator [Glaciimonas sp. PCH181]PUA19185.1 LysR family transcriptional regulator [Glaciimonas sp. PCH181]